MSELMGRFAHFRIHVSYGQTFGTLDKRYLYFPEEEYEPEMRRRGSVRVANLLHGYLRLSSAIDKAREECERIANEGFWNNGIFIPGHRVSYVHYTLVNEDETPDNMTETGGNDAETPV